MDFKEFFLAYEQSIRPLRDIKDNPQVITKIPKSGICVSGAKKMAFWKGTSYISLKPYKPIFRANKSSLKS